MKNGKIWHIKIDTFKIEKTSQTHYEMLIRYLKCLDTFYFMLAESDHSFHFLSNPLSSSRGWNFQNNGAG